MKILILHLSDMHFTQLNNYDKEKVTMIVAAMNNHILNIKNVLVVVSGDISFSGKKAEYIIASKFFRELKKEISKRYNIQDVKFVMVPGNHDVDYSIGEQTRADLESIEKEDLYNDKISEELRKQRQFYNCSALFSCFNNKNLLNQKTITYDSKKIQINLINTAVFSSKGEDQGFHYLPHRDIERLSNQNGADYVFSVMHHPHHWYSLKCKKLLEDALYTNSDLIFVGHEHFESEMTIKKDSNTVNIFAGGELCNKGDWSKSEFHIATLELDTREYISSNYQINTKNKIYEEFGEKRKLFLSKDRINSLGLKVTESFKNNQFGIDKHYISKSFMDYFVFPLLEEIPYEKPASSVLCEINTMNDFISKLEIEHKIIISGQIGSGKTSLSKAIFQELVTKKIVVYLKGEEVNGNFEKTIKSAFEDIYGNDSEKYEVYKQTDSSNKAIIIDDFDAIRKEYQEGFSLYIDENFNTIVETSLEEIDIDIQNRLKKRKNNKEFLHLRVAPFYMDKRRQLVTKVVDIIGNDGQSKENIINTLCNALTSQKSLYSWGPDFIVQFTKYYYNNIGDSTNNDGNVYSKVFENNLTSQIMPFVGSRITIDKIFVILDKIAFKIYKDREYPISTTKISGVIDEYNMTYDSVVNAGNLLSSLVNAKILKIENNGYLFYERNYLAYFTAREIRRQIYEGEFETIKHVMEFSYMHLNADILLFVTYITENRNIITMLMNLAESIVNEWEEFSLSPINISYLTGSALELIRPVEESDREKEEQRNIEQEKCGSHSLAFANDSSIFEIESEELNYVQEMMRSISLLITLARALPSFEHLLEKEYKDKCVELIYSMPLKIFYVWASQVDEIRSEMVQMIKDFHEWEYRKDKSDYIPLTDDKALFALRWESTSLLLELMHVAISYSTRDNTWRFLEKFNYKGSTTYSIEHLMAIAQRDFVDAFTNEAVRLKEEKTPLTQTLVQRVTRNYLLNSKNITSSEMQRINQKVFDGKIKQSALLIDKNKNKKKK